MRIEYDEVFLLYKHGKNCKNKIELKNWRIRHFKILQLWMIFVIYVDFEWILLSDSVLGKDATSTSLFSYQKLFIYTIISNSNLEKTKTWKNWNLLAVEKLLIVCMLIFKFSNGLWAWRNCAWSSLWEWINRSFFVFALAYFSVT